MSLCRLASVASFATALVLASAAHALPVTVTTPFMNLENRNINPLGVAAGRYLRIGADSVAPNTLSGTTAIATSMNAVTGAPITVSLLSAGSPLSPDMTDRYVTDSVSIRNPWLLTFTNGTNTTSTTVSLPTGATQAPFVNTVTLSGTAANPTFTWTPPAGAAIRTSPRWCCRPASATASTTSTASAAAVRRYCWRTTWRAARSTTSAAPA